jgi:hypothetical protein
VNLLCSGCCAQVADDDAAIEVCGLHQHTCTNPAGVTYVVSCFAAVSEAVQVVSNESSEWAWFPGYRWQLTACAHCGAQLGWKYTRADGSFHGLIVSRLTRT